MNDLWPKVRILIRAELLRLKLMSRLAATRAWHFALGIILAICGAAMMTLAGFLWLSEHYGPVVAALVTGGVFLLAALIAIVSGQRVKPGPEAVLIDELAQLARTGLEADLSEIERKVAHLEGQLRSVLSGGGGFAAPLSLLTGILAALSSRMRREPKET